MRLDSLFSALLMQYGYAALAPGIIVMGPLAPLLAGVLWGLGGFNPWIAYLYLLVGAMAGDLMWYWLGHRHGEWSTGRFGKFLGITRAHIERAKELFHKYHSPIILLTKVTNVFGFMIPMLFTAGLARIPLWRFALLNFIGEALFSGALMLVGFFFGDLYLWIDDALGKAAGAGVLLMAAVALFGIGLYVHSRVTTFFESKKI
jgi:membrane-associated protein